MREEEEPVWMVEVEVEVEDVTFECLDVWRGEITKDSHEKPG